MNQHAPRHGAGAIVAKHESFLRYRGFRWLIIATVLSAVAIGLFAYLILVEHYRLRHFGGTWLGYTLGTIGAGFIVWLTLLGARKRMITAGHWTLKAWVSAHVYLGLSLIVIATLHSGFQFGWNIHTLAYALMMIVILSGIFGITVYARLPTLLSENRGETTQKEMVEVIHSLDGRLLDAAQPLHEGHADIVRISLDETRIGGSLWERISGRHPKCATGAAYNKLSDARRGVRDEDGKPLDQVLGLLGQKSVTLAKARRHIRLRSMLEAWLYVHIPVTIALLAALTAHIISVFFYW